MKRLTFGVLAAAMMLASCDAPTVPNYNNPTPGGLAGDPIAGLRLAAAGLLVQNRATYAGYISDVGIFGRESYNFFPTDARNMTHYLAQNPLDPAGFASGGWAPRYTNIRNAFNFLSTVDAAGALSAAQKEAARGFAKTIEALELHYVIAQRHNLGAVVEVKANPLELAPFVSRDSVHNYIIARLEEASTNLAAGGGAFPFTLPAGFAGFNTPTTFRTFNRALAARVELWRAALGNPACGANGITCYQRALAAINASFINAGGSLTTGVYHVFSSESGDIRNRLNQSVDPDLVAHPSDSTDAPLQASGAKDLRYQAKFRRLLDAQGNPTSRLPSGGAANGIPTTIGFRMYPTDVSPAPIIRNEELILMRAEARYFTGDPVGALADINLIRTTSGGLVARGPFVDASDFITELLLQRRYSLMWEGHRWVDVRRYNRLTTLPLDLPNHFRQTQQPIPQAECDFRAPTQFRCPT